MTLNTQSNTIHVYYDIWYVRKWETSEYLRWVYANWFPCEKLFKTTLFYSVSQQQQQDQQQKKHHGNLYKKTEQTRNKMNIT